MEGAIDTLLICASFFGYAQEIRARLVKRGRRVALFEDRPGTDSGTRALIRVAPALVRPKADAYFADIVAKTMHQPIQDILVIKGEALSPAAIQVMRRAFPKARFTLYFWDAYLNMPSDSHQKVPLFDRVFSFDPHDVAADKRLTYQPLFYLDDYAKLRDTQPDIDVLFFGTMHGDRYAVLKRIERALPPTLSMQEVLYFQARWLYRLRKLTDPAFWPSKESEFVFSAKSKTEVLAMIGRARIVLDIERPVQSGFTMRTVEAVGAGRKLITTNPEVANADFYNPANIAIVDRDRPEVPEQFFNAAYVPVPPGILERYGLEAWLDEVMPETRRVPTPVPERVRAIEWAEDTRRSAAR